MATEKFCVKGFGTTGHLPFVVDIKTYVELSVLIAWGNPVFLSSFEVVKPMLAAFRFNNKHIVNAVNARMTDREEMAHDGTLAMIDVILSRLSANVLKKI